MIYILLSVFCSVTVAVFLKLGKRYNISIIQAVTINYLTALGLCLVFFKPSISSEISSSPWHIYIGLAILLPSIFLVLAASVKHIGIVKTDIAQRLSLFIPILAAYFIFGESFNIYKIIGLLVGFTAIILTLARKSKKEDNQRSWLLPIVVFLGFGIIDILFKQIALYKAIPYTTSLFVVFCLSFLVALIITIYMLVSGMAKLQLVNIACGFLLGIFNFGNILFYLKAHQALPKNPSTVFAAMNLGVIMVGSLVGILVFKERVNKLNYVGIALALVAIVLIKISQDAF
ncbi:DMT family transporter [Pedobacter sandarakinus]|uniref:DMT family transporter n=1 Tax=Pedobacter sandarakinus TaxID=353156 RepID=UPI0022480F09|nr:DMT family transporter [Pedobacter sandarakinus]MCX2574341.1 DMT family transporter [Pedobacter sandarakinus]